MQEFLSGQDPKLHFQHCQHVRISASKKQLENNVVLIRNMADEACEERFTRNKGIVAHVMAMGSPQSYRGNSSMAWERTPDWSLGKGSRACVECGIRLVSNNGRHHLPTSLAAQPLCKSQVQPQPGEPSPWSDLPSFTVKVPGSGAARLTKHSVPE